MEKINKIYEKLWKSLIMPERQTYNEDDVGPYEIKNEHVHYKKRLFKFKNELNEEFFASFFLPNTNSYDIIIYCHTHNNCRIEGSYLLDYIVSEKMGLVLFDFRANGSSSGKYVSFGIYEVMDLNVILKFILKNLKVNRINLWGRSMGAITIINFLSSDYRIFFRKLLKDNYNIDYSFVSYYKIDSIIIDSVIDKFYNSYMRLIKLKIPNIFQFIGNIVYKLLNKTIKNKIKIDLNMIDIVSKIDKINIPIFMFVGDKDELIDKDSYFKMFQSINYKIKKFRLIKGGHCDKREDDIITEIFSFIRYINNSKNSIKYDDILTTKNSIVNQTNIFVNLNFKSINVDENKFKNKIIIKSPLNFNFNKNKSIKNIYYSELKEDILKNKDIIYKSKNLKKEKKVKFKIEDNPEIDINNLSEINKLIENIPNLDLKFKKNYSKSYSTRRINLTQLLSTKNVNLNLNKTFHNKEKFKIIIEKEEEIENENPKKNLGIINKRKLTMDYASFIIK